MVILRNPIQSQLYLLCYMHLCQSGGIPLSTIVIVWQNIFIDGMKTDDPSKKYQLENKGSIYNIQKIII